MRESVTKGKKIWKESGFSSNRFGGSLLEGWYIYIEKREIGVDGKFGRRFLGLKKRCSSREPSNRERRSCRYVSRYSPCHRLISISPHPWPFLIKYSFLLLDVDVYGHLVVLLNPSPLYSSFYLFFLYMLCFDLITASFDWWMTYPWVRCVWNQAIVLCYWHLFSSPLTK